MSAAAEVECDDPGRLAAEDSAGCGVEHDREAGLVEEAAQKVGAVPRRAHPGVDDRCGARCRAAEHGEVLTDRPRSRAWRIETLDPFRERCSVAGLVREEPVDRHRAGVGCGGARQRLRCGETSEAASCAYSVDLPQHKLLERG